MMSKKWTGVMIERVSDN